MVSNINNIDVLVVDNNPVLLKAVTAFLAKEGCSVRSVRNGLEALEKIEEKIPDIVFTDLIMPLMDGEKLCRKIRSVEQYRSIFVVVISALLQEDRERIISEVDCDVFIGKGSLAELRTHIQSVLVKFQNREVSEPEILGVQHSDNSEDLTFTQELLLEKNHLHRMLGNLSEGILEISNNGRIVSANKSALKILQVKDEVILGKTISELDWGVRKQAITRWLNEEFLQTVDTHYEITEEDPLHIHNKVITASFLKIGKPGIHFGLCILRDITRQYIAEKKKEEIDNAIKLVKKMDAMSCMAGGVAHDFNNLLTVICGNLDMVSCSNELSELHREKELLDSARNSAYSAVQLIRKISHFSPFGIVSRERINLNELIQNGCNEFFIDDSEKRYTIIEEESGISVSIDSFQIKKALHNVLQNSVESSPEGLIEVKICTEKFAEQHIRAGQYIAEGHYGVIKVTDEGSGIPQENIHAVFDPYFSTKQRSSLKGMGLGLTIVYATLRNHGGFVTLESEEGTGTCVSLLLPIHTEKKKIAGKDKEKILIVESDEELRSISKIMCEYLGYLVIEATTRSEAVQLIKTELGREPVNVALINLNDDGRRHGVDLCTALHKVDPELKVVVCSGSSFDPIMKKYKDFGFSSSLIKPYTMDDLKKTLWSLND